MSDEIHDKYQQLAKKVRLLADGKILKTDCWQEWQDYNPIKADVYLELRGDRVNETKEKKYNVIQGSILGMPFKDNSMGAILDTSTIDHVEDYEKVLQEYSRVLKDKGYILIIYWSNPDETVKDGLSWGDLQFCFHEETFKKDFLKHFDIIEEPPLKHKHGRNVLLCYIGRKK